MYTRKRDSRSTNASRATSISSIGMWRCAALCLLLALLAGCAQPAAQPAPAPTDTTLIAATAPTDTTAPPTPTNAPPVDTPTPAPPTPTRTPPPPTDMPTWPKARTYPGLIYDANSERVLLIGGIDKSQST